MDFLQFYKKSGYNMTGAKPGGNKAPGGAGGITGGPED
jgi:hypothetical protein